MIDISELNALRARIDQLEAQAASDRDERDERDEQRTSRRGMLRLAGAAAAGGLAAVVTAEPAAAADPNDVVLGQSLNVATAPTGISISGTPAYGIGCYESPLAGPDASLGKPAVFGHAVATCTTGVAGHSNQTMGFGIGVLGFNTDASGDGTAVRGQVNNNTGQGVSGISTGATGILAYGKLGVYAIGVAGAIKLDGNSVIEPPSRATFFERQTIDSDTNNIWYCYESGTPGKWRKLAGPATAGAFHAITPTRVYDSRAAAPTPGLLAAGANRTVSVADGRDANGTVTTTDLVPAGATAVAANVTVTGTTGTGGFLAVNPGGTTAISASTINWFGAGQNIANGVTLTLNTTRQLTVVCGTGGSTHFIIDIAGYYL